MWLYYYKVKEFNSVQEFSCFCPTKKVAPFVNAEASYLVKVGGEIGAQFDHEVPPDLHLGEQQGLGSHVDGRERLHEELQALAAAENVCKEERCSVSGLLRRTGFISKRGVEEDLG